MSLEGSRRLSRQDGVGHAVQIFRAFNGYEFMARPSIPTEPIGSIPRPLELLKAIEEKGANAAELDSLYDEAIRDTIRLFEETGSPVISDGEQRKYHNFWTYSVHGLPNMAPDGFKIPFSAGHVRRMPRLTQGPFRYLRRADSYLDTAKRYAKLPLKQAVISPSALSLLYPDEELPGYSRDAFIQDLLREHETEVRNCLAKGAVKVQIDFTEGRLAIKIDPTGTLLHDFIDLNNLALSRFSAEERQRIGIHTCPGGDRDSTHSADVDYAELLRACSNSKRETFMSPWQASLTGSAFCISSASTSSRISGCLSAS